MRKEEIPAESMCSGLEHDLDGLINLVQQKEEVEGKYF